MYNFKGLDDYFNNSFESFGTDCLALAVACGGELVYDFYKADNSKEEYKNFNDCTRFNIMSVSEIFIGILLVRLIEEGKISADDYVKSYIPEFKYDDIRLIQLMTHTSGFRAVEEDVYSLDEKSFLNMIYEAVREEDKEYNFYKFGYSVLIDIIQRVTCQKIEDYAEEVIYKPLNLRRTSFYPTDNTIFPYDSKTGKFFDFSKAAPVFNTGIYSTARDLIKLGDMFLDFPAGRETKILSGAGFEYSFTPCVFGDKKIRTPIFTKRSDISANTSFGELSSPNTFGRSGDSGCMLSIDTDNDIGIVILTNSIEFGANPANYKRIVNRIMASM